MLLVEDDPLISDILARKLCGSNFGVFQASSGDRAFQILENEKGIDIILLDLLLPGMNGFEILKKLKEDTALSTIPVVILSNLNEEVEIEKAKKMGAIDYWVKIDVPLEEVASRVKNICGA